LVLAVLVAACSGDVGERTAATNSPATTATPSTTATNGRAADLDAASVVLTKVADVFRGTATAVRRGDPALYVAVQNGQVVALRDGKVEPVLDLSTQVTTSGEHGLLGLAFSPDGTELYVHYSAAGSGDTTLESFAFTGGQADPATRRLLLTVPDLQPNHNGGDLKFGPDGKLYLALGDGGGANDVGAGHAFGGNAQALDSLNGKILRLDPKGSLDAGYTIPPDNPFAIGGGRPEVWVYGLRNPWRFSFDRATDDLWIADVGQGAWEEIDMAPFAVASGANFGWNLLEGTHDLRGGATPGATVLPVFETSHADGNCAITGGYVYRGKRIPDLVGAYLFSDYCNSTIRAIRVENGQVVAQRDLGIASASIASFGEDNDGELYVLSQSRGIFRIDPA
jgi:glucose/arabinose dehydrogenase